MLSALMVTLLFLTTGTIVLAGGIFTLQSEHKSAANRLFFLIAIAIALWSSGMALSSASTDAATGEFYRRIASIGWGTVYALLLHFILIITDKTALIKKRWIYFCLYLPALLNIFAFAIPNPLNPHPYNLQQTKFGWINVPINNAWDWLFYAYYASYILIGIYFLYRWGKNSSDDITKKKSRIIMLSLFLAVIIGTITDVVINSLYSELPQMAPFVMLIPTISIYHILQKDSFHIAEGINKKTSYISLFSSIFVYIVLAAVQVLFPKDFDTIGSLVFDQTAIKGIIVQIQMLISIYLVLKENRPGYIAAVMMNAISLISAIAYITRHESFESLPGIISYTGVLVVITLIRVYKEKNEAYIKKINTQAVREDFYFNVFKQAPVGIAIINDTEYAKSKDFDDVSINPSYERILGRTKDELKTIDWTQITHPDDLVTDREYFEQFKKGNIDYYSREKRYLRPDGSAVWVDMLISRFANPNEKPGDHVCIITDITERKRIEDKLKYDSEHVMLTGLYNRGVLENILEKDAIYSLSGKRALICVNLFAMHALSKRYGYNYSQTMLKNIAYSLKAFCNENYMLFDATEYRFVFYAKGYGDKNELTVFCKKISQTLSSYLYVHGIKYAIGILQIDNTISNDTGDMLKKVMDTSEIAEESCQNSKNILFYSPEFDKKITRENDISKEIKEIAEGTNADRLFLQYQPIIDIATNSICGFEALARLKNEKHGIIPPLEFIQIAEKTNMIVSFGDTIIIKALSFLNKLKENGHDKIIVTINISTLQMLEEGFAGRLISMISEIGINPGNIGIELTESVFATERREINKVIDTLRSAGIMVLIDDFGTGYSSLAREQELNTDCLKIDKSFIDRLLTLQDEESITEDIISMAHKLGHCVIAEGVEHVKQFDYLVNHGCDRIQGYLISKPLDEKAALDFIENSLRQKSEKM